MRAPVARLFLREGYDGYMRMDAWCVSLRNDLERSLAAEVEAESLRLRLWRKVRLACRDRVINSTWNTELGTEIPNS